MTTWGERLAGIVVWTLLIVGAVWWFGVRDPSPSPTVRSTDPCEPGYAGQFLGEVDPPPGCDLLPSERPAPVPASPSTPVRIIDLYDPASDGGGPECPDPPISVLSLPEGVELGDFITGYDDAGCPTWRHIPDG